MNCHHTIPAQECPICFPQSEEGSHHLQIFTKAGVKIGYLRITNSAKVLSIYLGESAVSNSGLFFPENSQ